MRPNWRDILLIAGWDDRQVSVEGNVVPVYRALVAAGAKSVRIAAFQDDHLFSRTADGVVTVIAGWVKGQGNPPPGA